MINQKVTIINKLGLHARAAAKLVAVTSRYGCSIEIGNQNKMVDAKSIMSVMLLAASKGTELAIRVDGENEQQALQDILDLVNNFFDEGE
jgi:phosphocarrier protein